MSQEIGATQWAEYGPNYRSRNGDCRCSAATIADGTWNDVCRRVFGQEWDYANKTHWHGCEDLGDGQQCADQGTPYCKKMRYTSDSNAVRKRSCCINRATGAEPFETCNPALTQNSDGCHDILKEYCSQESNFFSDQCKSWLKQAGADADVIAGRICRYPAYQGQEWCACWNIPIPQAWKNLPDSDPMKATLIGSIRCFDDKCQSGVALKPSDMKPCDINLAVCKNENIQARVANESNINELTIHNFCKAGSSDSTGTGTGGTDGSSGTDDGTASDQDEEKKWYQKPVVWLLIILAFLCLILITGGGYYAFSR